MTSTCWSFVFSYLCFAFSSCILSPSVSLWYSRYSRCPMLVHMRLFSLWQFSRFCGISCQCWTVTTSCLTLGNPSRVAQGTYSVSCLGIFLFYWNTPRHRGMVKQTILEFLYINVCTAGQTFTVHLLTFRLQSPRMSSIKANCLLHYSVVTYVTKLLMNNVENMSSPPSSFCINPSAAYHVSSS